MKKSSLLALCFSLAFSFCATAQGLAPSALLPVADGVVNSGEYSLNGTYLNMKFSSSLSSDGKTLFFALEAPASGWVSIGLGSLKMDGAFMVLGYDDKGKPFISEDTGKGHGHKPNKTKILESEAVKEENKITTLEFSLPASGFNGTLKILLAYGRGDNFSSMHSKFTSFEISLKK
jgi:hypothetical protein